MDHTSNLDGDRFLSPFRSGFTDFRSTLMDDGESETFSSISYLFLLCAHAPIESNGFASHPCRSHSTHHVKVSKKIFLWAALVAGVVYFFCRRRCRTLSVRSVFSRIFLVVIVLSPYLATYGIFTLACHKRKINSVPRAWVINTLLTCTTVGTPHQSAPELPVLFAHHTHGIASWCHYWCANSSYTQQQQEKCLSYAQQ